MNPFKVLKLYARWKPQIETTEAAIKDAEKHDMKDFWIKIRRVVLPIVYAAAGGAAGALADYAHTAVSGEHVDLSRMGAIAVTGAGMALKAYFQDPKQRPVEDKK